VDLYRISNLTDLKELLDLLRHYDVGEFEVEAEGRKLRISKGAVIGAAPGLAMFPAAGQLAAAAAPGAAAPGEAPAPAAELPPGIKVVTSPMVGTFYRAPSPEADPFVDVGDRVTEDSTLCIIEAMKVMNEITAGSSGVVKGILADNGQSVEFGQPLFHILAD
jgi:acetyl-CoA carboxylase biotin carboxyl carrier protein